MKLDKASWRNCTNPLLVLKIIVCPGSSDPFYIVTLSNGSLLLGHSVHFSALQPVTLFNLNILCTRKDVIAHTFQKRQSLPKDPTNSLQMKFYIISTSVRS